MTNVVDNPFPVGTRVLVPAGTVVHSTDPSAPARVTAAPRHVAVRSSFDGWVDIYGEHGRTGALKLPSIRWAGRGGYWQEAQVTPELLAANGAAALTPPNLDAWDLSQVGHVPTLVGLPSNRWLLAHRTA